MIFLFHHTPEPGELLENLIQIFTDKNDVVIDPCAGSGTTLLAAAQCDRRAYGFEIKKNFCKEAKEKVLSNIQKKLFAECEPQTTSQCRIEIPNPEGSVATGFE
jgi:DNA modification methylase